MSIGSTSSLTSGTSPFCHRCGKPSENTYLSNTPTCAWCLAELNSHKRPLFSMPPSPSLTAEDVRQILREELETALAELQKGEDNYQDDCGEELLDQGPDTGLANPLVERGTLFDGAARALCRQQLTRELREAEHDSTDPIPLIVGVLHSLVQEVYGREE